MGKTAALMGKLGLPATTKELSTKNWDVILVGAGHNGLTCAAYLARAGKRVLVLEARERVGGACTLEEAWPGFRVSPCAYIAGLLHPRVLSELNFAAHGFEWTPASGGMFVPFADGSSIQMWDDDAECEREIASFSPADLAGWRAMGELKTRLRNYLRPDDERDLWLEPNPTRAEIEDRLGNDDEARQLLFHWSMAEFTERYLTDERLQIAYLGQGVIGTNASPFDPGTAAVHFHHASGKMGGLPGTWGYVKGGMGNVSFILADIAQEAGARIACGVAVREIIPQTGVRLESGELISAPIVISNADPKVTARLLGKHADPQWQNRVDSVPIEGCTVKLNLALKELPNFTARPGTFGPHHRGQINTPLTKDEWREGFETARNGELPARLWTELYFHTAYDSTVAPPGIHTMSVFAQYVPYRFRRGTWDERRAEVRRTAIESIARFAPNLPGAILHEQVMGPPDIEEKVGLTGGHIFQGDCRPQYLWENRLTARTPMPGVFLCGAGTHPGGSVIAVNGRNAAMEVLKWKA